MFIGERVWFNEIDDTAWHDVQDPEGERRKSGMSVGLKNLGATCYVNTFLQLWFHNETVKEGKLKQSPYVGSYLSIFPRVEGV